MSTVILVVVTAIVFLIGEVVMLPNVMEPLFRAALGDQMLDDLRLGPAALFYLVHIAGLTWFATRPALRNDRPSDALRDGGFLGIVAYGCYEFTSWTIMRDWTVTLVIVDIAWGAVISGVSAWAAVKAARAMRP